MMVHLPPLLYMFIRRVSVISMDETNQEQIKREALNPPVTLRKDLRLHRRPGNLFQQRRLNYTYQIELPNVLA